MSALPQPELPRDPAFEKHLTVTQIAELWGRSYNLVKRLFENEPGVVKLVSNGTLAKRRYTTLTVPASVVQRVHARLEVQAKRRK